VYAVIRRRRLDPAVWMVVTFGFLTLMIPAVGISASQGSRFTHWALGDKLNAPLFTINGNPFNAAQSSQALLFISIVYAVYRFSVDNMRRKNALEQEFKSARELQQALIPDVLPPVPGFALTSSYRPASEVGGDFFQIVPLDGNSTLIILGDVSGKGLKAAMTVSLIVGSARMLAEFTSSPSEILAGLNRRLLGRLQGGFATCIALRLQRDGRCTIASAGHPGPFLNDREASIQGALPLGLFSAVTYEETFFILQAGDRLALYTDGLLEARNASGELYSFDRLRALFAAKPTAEEATQAAVAFGQDDDITVLSVTRLG
jgi:serine phosphatase RsbU (regulator of sigma subunit)